MSEMTATETQLTAEAAALTLVLQKLVKELSSLDGSIASRLEREVRSSFAEAKAAAGSSEREAFLRAFDGVIDSIFTGQVSGRG